MRARLWPFIYLGVLAGGAGAILSAMDQSDWIIFATVLIIVIIFALLQEALRDPVEVGDIVMPPSGPLPTGFGRALLEQMPLPLLVVSPAGRVTYGNLAAKELLPKFGIGDHFASIFRAPIFVEAVNAALSRGQSGKAGFTTGRVNARYYEVNIGLLPAGSEFGDTMQAIIEIEDRTEEHLGKKMRRDFIANASHELRTPLASIIGYIETLQGHAKDDPAARDEFLKIMDKQAQRMQRLVDDLMSLSRIELNEHIRPQDLCELHDLGQEAVAALLPLQEKYGVTLSVDLSGDAHVLADRDQINQVLINLIDNAMKYGGNSVQIYQAAATFEYPDMTGLTIKDNGEGIPPKHLPRLTERFYRVNATQSRNKGGTGLGLAIVKHILVRHGGELQVASTVGAGTEFTIWLPQV